MSEQVKTCPFCFEQIQLDAVVCKHCRQGVPSQAYTPEQLDLIKKRRDNLPRFTAISQSYKTGSALFYTGTAVSVGTVLAFGFSTYVSLENQKYGYSKQPFLSPPTFIALGATLLGLWLLFYGLNQIKKCKEEARPLGYTDDELSGTLRTVSAGMPQVFVGVSVSTEI